MKQNMQSLAFAGLHILYTKWVVCMASQINIYS